MPRWLRYTLLTMLLWGGWAVASQPVSTTLSSWEVLCLSTFGLLPVLVPLGFSRRLREGPKVRAGFVLALVSGIIAAAGNVAYYQAFAAGGKAAAVTPLTALYPLVTIFLAMPVLHERLNLVQAAGVVLSLLALLCFNVGGPDAAFLSPWLAVALIPIALWGVSALLQKMASTRVSAEGATFAFLLGFVPAALVIPLFHPVRLSHPPTAWGLLLLVGFLFSLGNYTLIFAYTTGGRASIVTPMASLYSLVTLPLAVLLLHEKIGRREGLGIAMAALAVVALSRESAPPPAFEVVTGGRPATGGTRKETP